MNKNLLGMFLLSPSLVFSTFAFSADMGTIDYESKVPAGIVSNMNTAAELSALGAENKDALMLITAARILQSVGAQPKPQEKETAGGTKSKKQESGVTAMSVDDLLAQAKDFAGENKQLLALIEETSQVKSRGRAHGPALHYDSIQARATDTYHVTFKANERAEIYIEGDGDTDLDLYVYDSDGNLGCKDTDGSDRMYCTWVPTETHQFVIKIKNFGDVYNRYGFATN
ncbi:MAG: hypothetical protein ACI9T7_000639 [Oleiphilaceae bacterium]|jgi:hypothetical protein